MDATDALPLEKGKRKQANPKKLVVTAKARGLQAKRAKLSSGPEPTTGTPAKVTSVFAKYSSSLFSAVSTLPQKRKR
jgi:hypothetical protein